MKQNVEALQYYESALELEPQNAAALVNTAVILNVLGRHTQAVSHAERALKIDPSMVEVSPSTVYHSTFSRCLRMHGNYTQHGQQPWV